MVNTYISTIAFFASVTFLCIELYRFRKVYLYKNFQKHEIYNSLFNKKGKVIKTKMIDLLKSSVKHFTLEKKLFKFEFVILCLLTLLNYAKYGVGFWYISGGIITLIYYMYIHESTCKIFEMEKKLNNVDTFIDKINNIENSVDLQEI